MRLYHPGLSRWYRAGVEIAQQYDWIKLAAVVEESPKLKLLLLVNVVSQMCVYDMQLLAVDLVNCVHGPFCAEQSRLESSFPRQTLLRQVDAELTKEWHRGYGCESSSYVGETTEVVFEEWIADMIATQPLREKVPLVKGLCPAKACVHFLQCCNRDLLPLKEECHAFQALFCPSHTIRGLGAATLAVETAIFSDATRNIVGRNSDGRHELDLINRLKDGAESLWRKLSGVVLEPLWIDRCGQPRQIASRNTHFPQASF